MVSLCKLLKRDALTSLIEDELVREYASKHGIAITDAEFRRQWTIIFRDRFHDMNAVVAANAKRYGMTVAQLKASIRMDLLRNAVMFQVTRAMPSTLPAVRLSRIVAATPKQMKVIERRLTSGVPFNQLATSLSAEKKNLCVTAGCGEMGWVPNVFISTPEHAVLTAPTGTVVGPIPGQTMIELLKVEGHSPAKPLTPNQSLQHRQQLFSAWQAHQVQKASVKRYVAT
jgi:parvulin-like peptidyl-prolyl isomerase